jgi:hypothetical protein
MIPNCLVLGVGMFLATSIGVSQSQEQYFETIEDNSFLLEEAYNQESGVVQHIFSAMHFATPHLSWEGNFSQEWPLWSQAHQISYSIPYSSLGGGSVHGIGDVIVHYRYQLSSSSDFAAMAPRLSIIFPTGSHSTGLGSGRVGVQMGLPASKRLSAYWVMHANVSLTLTPLVSGTDMSGKSVEHTLTGWSAGASVIYLASPVFNVMLEAVVASKGEIGLEGEVSQSVETIVSPGLRYAMNAGELQIVPGMAVPIAISDGESRAGLLFYLSLEHPF